MSDKDFVKKTQRLLNNIGTEPRLTEDGVPGPKTMAALDAQIAKTGPVAMPPTTPPVTPPKPVEPGVVAPVYPKPHPFHPRFDHLLKAPFTHIHPFDVLRSVAGEKEIPGSKDNPLIAHFHEHSGNLGTHSDTNDYSDEVPHCASAINWACDMAGCKKTNNAMASSFDNYPGVALKPGDWVEVGDLVRIAHPGGHITFANKRFQWKPNGTFEGFGSNQGNTIKTSIYDTDHIKSVHRVTPLPGTVLAPIGILGNKPIPATGTSNESTR